MSVSLAFAQSFPINQGELFVCDAFGGSAVGALIRIQPLSGSQKEVSPGGMMNRCTGMAISPNGDIFVVGQNGLARVNPVTGEQTIIPGGGRAVAVAPNGSPFAKYLFVVMGNTVGRIDPQSGALTTVSAGGSLISPTGIAVASNGDLFIADQLAQAIIRVDPTTGTQAVVTSHGSLVAPTGIAIGANGDLFVADMTGEILRIRPGNPMQYFVSQGQVSELVNMRSIAIGPDGQIYVAGDAGTNARVVQVDPTTGKLRRVSAGGIFNELSGVVVVPIPINTVTLNSVQDTYVRTDVDERRNDNYGMQSVFEIGTGRGGGGLPYGGANAMRALVQFDVSPLPILSPGASASMQLTLHSYDNGSVSSTYNVEAHRIVETPSATPWTEGNGVEGSGGPPGWTDPDSAYGVAWEGPVGNPNPDPAGFNNDPQPDYSPAVEATVSINQGIHKTGDVFRWNVSSLVRQYQANAFPNYGLMLVDSTTDGLFRGIRFGAREGKQYGIPGAVDGPKLVITFAGDIDRDGNVDMDDMNLLIQNLNKTVGASKCGSACDIDGDGTITVLDSRKLALLCSRPLCATK